MRFGPADGVKVSSRCFDDLVSKVTVQSILDLLRYHRQTVFGVPGDVEIDLGVDRRRHSILEGR